MSDIRSILCASDLSEGADEAIRQAAALARSRGAALEVLHVVPNPLATDPAFAQLTHHAGARAALEAAREQARAELTSRVASVKNGAPKECAVRVSEGVPYAAIVSRAEEAGADLVVVGGKGASGLKMERLGEVAEKVVRHAPVSVLVARRGPGGGKVLAATDLSDASLPALTAAAEESRRRKATLTVIHNVDPELKEIGPAILSALVQVFSDDYLAELGHAARSRLVEALERLGVKGDVVITPGSAGASILRLTEKLPAELVVVANSGSTGLASVLLGSVAETVVRWAPCSVLVVRHRG
jgi:nucleotide-binding universal stress UspA family protein